MANKLALSVNSVTAAKSLVGCYLEREISGQRLLVRIVETEAYDQRDTASHSFKGQTPRTEVMFGPPGHAYVYFTYGMHHCFNIVVGPTGYGSAVLIRAVEPVEGTELMCQNRRVPDDRQLTNGPAKLCYALGIDRRLNGHDLSKAPLRLLPGAPLKSAQIVQTTRIGITKDTHRRWRFYELGNPYVSKR